MNINNYISHGKLTTFSDIKCGEIGLFNSASYGDEMSPDSLVIACRHEDEKLEELANKHGAIGVVLSLEKEGQYSSHLSPPSDDWIYLPNQIPQIEIDFSTRQKSRYDRPQHHSGALYLSVDRKMHFRLKQGSIELTTMAFSQKRPDFDRMMPVKTWGFFTSDEFEKAAFWCFGD